MAKPAKKPKMGRPPVAKEAKRSTHIKVMTTPAEKEELEQAADAAGLGVSSWMRTLALEKARS